DLLHRNRVLDELTENRIARGCFLELLAGAPHAQLRGRDRRADKLCDFGERAAVDLVERKRKARCRTELVEHGVEALHAIARELPTGTRAFAAVDVFILEDIGDDAASALREVAIRDAHGDAIDPRRE